MMEYRAIRPMDVPAVAALAQQALASAGDLPLHVSAVKVRAQVAFFASDRGAHFQMAAFRDGVPVAAVAAVAQEMPFHERAEAVVVMCFSTVTGAGFRLLRAMLRWFDADFRLRRLVWPMNVGFDERLRFHAARMGFGSQAPMFVRYK